MITIILDIPHPVEHVWNNLTNWEAHSAWIPNTTVTITHQPDSDNQPNGLGTQFTGITRLGPFTLNDPMTVTTYQPPLNGQAHATVTKTGTQLTGTAGFTLTAINDTTTRLIWFEDVQPQPARLFNWVTPLTNWFGTLMFTRALKKFVGTL